MTRERMVTRPTLAIAVAAVSCVLLLLTPPEAATRAECRPSACALEITTCKSACPSTPKRKKRSCRRKCKRTVTSACRSDEQACGGGGGGGGGGQCQAYTATNTCPARSLAPLRDRNPICIGPSGAAQPCDLDFDTKFRVRTPWRTHAGACCVIDTCRGKTSFGVYDNLAMPPLFPPGQSLLLAPVTVTVQSLSSYFQKPPPAGVKGQWGHHTATILSLGCSTPPADFVISVAGGPVTAVDRGDFLSYDTRPVPPPTGTWDFLTLTADGTGVSFAPPQPPLLPPCGSVADTTKCQPHVFDLQNLNYPGSRNPIIEILSERIGLDRLCDDAVFASAEGTFRRQDGSQCAVTIYAEAKIGCESNDDCIPGEVCTATDPASPADFGSAFPGWAGRSCVIPTQ
jgi:hypothetical protein